MLLEKLFTIPVLFFAVPLHSSPPQQPTEAVAVAEVRSLAQRLHTAYAIKSTEGVLAEWNEQAPQFAAVRAEIEKLSHTDSNVLVSQSTLRDPEVVKGMARIRIAREITEFRPEATPGTTTRKILVLECVQEHGTWKVNKELPATDDFAARASAAATTEERLILLSQDEDLLGPPLVSSLLSRASELRHSGELGRALAMDQFALTVAEKAQDDDGRAFALSNIGLIHYDRSEFQDALDWLKKSMDLAESRHNAVGVARALNNTASVYLDTGNLTEAQSALDKSLAIAETLKNDRMTGNAIGNLANLAARRGDYLKALAFMEKSYRADERTGDDRGRTIELLNIGNIFLWQGGDAQAKSHFEQALSIAQAQGLKPLVSVASLGLGRVAEFGGDFKEAERLLASGLSLANEVGNQLTAAIALTYLGDTYSQMGNHTEAVKYFQKGIDLQRSLGATSEAILGMTRMAAAYSVAGNFEATLRVATEAAEQAQAAGARDPLWRARFFAGEAYRKLGQPAKAKAEYLASIAGIEDLRMEVAGSEFDRQLSFAGKVAPYHRMMEMAAGEGNAAEAFAYAERAKARVLVDLFTGGRSQLTALMTADERRLESDFRVRIATLNSLVARERRNPQENSPALRTAISDLDRVRLQYSGYESRLYAEHPDWRAKTGRADPISLEECARLIPGSDTAMVEFAATDARLYTFVLSTGKNRGADVRVFSVPVDVQNLAARVATLRKQFESRAPAFRTTAAHLYRLLLAPAATALANKRLLIVVPDGALWSVPFDALPTPDGGYLIDRTTICYAPSATALKAMLEMRNQRRQSPAKLELLAMGNPAWDPETRNRAAALYRDAGFGPLPLAETEVRRLGQIYGSSQSRVYIGPEARESRFKTEAPDARVIHLATHGVANDASPLYSHIILASEREGSQEDGLLEAWELVRMNLHAELAVLSACDTARGRVAPGEGMIGLSWALFVSGVPATVISQWKVQSDSTSALMIEFHQNRKRGLSDAAALHAASLTLRKNPAYKHPFYWAPFVLIGAGI
jgi:CHAT domain-containing protein/tetratricopeptide (TPR) repeat protein